MAGLLERMGWSDEVEMLARVTSYLSAIFTKADKVPKWEDFLPVKYRAVANYSLIPRQTPEEVEALSESMQKAFHE